MKNGRSLMELAQELERQRNAKRDYLLDTRNLEKSPIVRSVRHWASLPSITIRCAQRIPNCWRRM